MKYASSGKNAKPPDNRQLILRAAIFNAIVLGALTGIGFVIVSVFFGGKLPPQAASYVVIGFYLAGLFTTSIVYRFHVKKKLGLGKKKKPAEPGAPPSAHD